MAGRFTTLEYRRLEKATEEKLKNEEENSIEWHDYKNILSKIRKIINKAEQAELKGEDEYENTRSKNKWQCDNCGIVKISMVKQCTVCKQSGENIKLVLLDDDDEQEQNKED